MNPKKMGALVIDALEDIKAKNIVMINVSKITSMFDYIVIASGDSNRQTNALINNVRDKLKEAGAHVYGSEGEETGEWVLLDLGDIVVHVMLAATREYYRLEELWRDGKIEYPKPEKETETGLPASVKVKARTKAKAEAKEPAAKKSAAKKPATKRPATKKPVDKKPAARKPAASKPSCTRKAGAKTDGKTAAKATPTPKATGKATAATTAKATGKGTAKAGSTAKATTQTKTAASTTRRRTKAEPADKKSQAK